MDSYAETRDTVAWLYFHLLHNFWAQHIDTQLKKLCVKTLLTKPSVYIRKYREISQVRDVKDTIYYMDVNNTK